jgi:hypothetical protein
VPSVLRSRLALFGILGVFLIPVVTTNLRGLTHVLTCQGAAETPFTLQIGEDGSSTIASSQVLTRDDVIEDGSTGAVGGGRSLCGGLTLQMGATALRDDKITISVDIANSTEFDWRGSVELNLRGIFIPLDIGTIASESTASDAIDFTLDAGTHELDGSLLIGP